MMDPILMHWLFVGAKLLFVVVALLQIVPVMAWVERRGAALIQNRLGPDRVGPLGLLQSLADAVKFFTKEDPVPGYVNKWYYTLAPIVALIPAFTTMAVVPFASEVVIAGETLKFQLADLNVGFLFVFALAGLGVYGIIIAGWASNSKYALLGSLRSSAQMISYELTMTLAVVGAVLAYGTLDLMEMAKAQGELLFGFLPAWGIFTQPLGCLLFLIAIFAETNRLPFDMAEGESEIVAGYHLEYGSMKFAMFMMAEYLNMTTGAALLVTFFFGGWQFLPGFGLLHEVLSNLIPAGTEVFRILLEFGSFFLKVFFFMWFFVWVRWTLPKFRYDQVMAFGWKVLLPLSFVNVALIAVLVAVGIL